jgi:uncharacterized protein (DUF2141 family)
MPAIHRVRPASRTAAAALTGCLLCVASSTSAAEPPVTKQIDFRASLKARGGVVRCGLFTSAGWLEKPVRSALASAKTNIATCTFRNVEPGTYGVSAFHDRNNNGKLDKNWIGMPVEDYGASNDARGTFGPPRFEDAKFRFEGGHVRLSARLE